MKLKQLLKYSNATDLFNESIRSAHWSMSIYLLERYLYDIK